MGIVGFTEWFRTTFPFAAFPIQQQENAGEFDHVLVDMNQFVHLQMRKAKNEEHLLIKVFSHLDKLFKMLVPFKTVVLALDGPASKAKFMEQRKRRKQKKVRKTSIYVKNFKKKEKEPAIDKLHITPGCAFMQKVKDALSFWACSRLQSQKYRNLRIHISGADVAGEGEIKLVKFIKSMRAQGIYGPEDTYCIVGSDADMVLLGLSLGIPNISILTEHNKDGATPGPNGKIKKSRSFLSVQKLMEHFASELPNAIESSVAVDFLTMAMLMGNDYLPKFPGANLNMLWRRYLHLRGTMPLRYLFHDDKLDLVFFLELMRPFGRVRLRGPPINFVKAHERRMGLAQKSSTSGESNAKEASTLPVSTDSLNESMGDDDDDDEEELLAAASAAATATAGSPIDGVEVVVADAAESESNGNASGESEPAPAPTSAGEDVVSDFEEDIDGLTVNDLWAQYDPVDHVAEYLVGLETTVLTYLRGECIDYNWFYPYSGAPTLQQFTEFAAPGNRARARALTKQKRDPIKNNPRREPLPPYKFCLMLLPFSAADHIASPLRQLMDKDSVLSPIYHGQFRAYIDCDLIEKEIDTALPSESLSSYFTSEELEYSVFHPPFYYEHYSRNDNYSASFQPPPLPTSRTRPLNKPYRLRKGVLDPKDLTESNPPPAQTQNSHPFGRDQFSSPARGAGRGQATGPAPQATTNDRSEKSNWRQRAGDASGATTANGERYVPPHQRPGASKFDRDNNRYNDQRQTNGRQRRNSNSETFGAQAQPAAAPTPAAAPNLPLQFPPMSTDPAEMMKQQLAFNQQMLAMMQQQQQQQQQPQQTGAPVMPFFPPMVPFMGPPPMMTPTEFGPDGLPIKRAPQPAPRPQFQDPAIVGFAPQGGIPFPMMQFFPGMPPMGVPPMGMPSGQPPKPQ